MTEMLGQKPKGSSLRRLAIVLVLVLIAGLWFFRGMPQSALSELEKADRYEVLSLNPDRLENGDFHGYVVLGSTLVTDSAIQRKLTDALQSGARWNDGTRYACFSPRHGIRATSGLHVTDFVICFECQQVRVIRDGKGIANFTTSKSPEPTFDSVLKNAGVLLAPKNSDPVPDSPNTPAPLP